MKSLPKLTLGLYHQALDLGKQHEEEAILKLHYFFLVI